MQDLELLFAMLVVFAWVVVQVIQRALKRPRPLGTTGDRPEALQPWPLAGEATERPPVRDEPPPIPPPSYEAHDPPAMARRPARAPQARMAGNGRRRHPHRPRLRTVAELRDAVVLAAVLGPCRALEPYEAPDVPR